MKNPHSLQSPSHAAWRAGFNCATVWLGTKRQWATEHRWFRISRPGFQAFLDGRVAGAKLFKPN